MSRTRPIASTFPAPPPAWLDRLSVGLIPTFECNLRCRHCYVAPTRTTPAADAWPALIEALAQRPPRNLGITGGEFLAWHDRGPLLDALEGAPWPVTILSNGFSLEATDRRALLRIGAHLLLSLDGPRPRHDELRGAGSFQRLEASAAAARADGIPFGFTMTVTRTSLTELGDTVDLALRWGGDGLGASPYQLLGAPRDDEGWVLTEDDQVDLLARIAALRRRLPAGFRLYAPNLVTRDFVMRNPCAVHACDGQYCPSRKYWPDRLFVLPDGTVLPQSQHIHPQYALGNAFEQGWDALLAGYWGSARHERFQALCRHIYQDVIVAQQRLVYYWGELLSEVSPGDPDALPRHEHIHHPHDHGPDIEEARRAGAELDFPRR